MSKGIYRRVHKQPYSDMPDHVETILMELTREELRLSYNAVCNAYLAAFCEKHGYDYEPDAGVGDDPGGIAEVGDLFVSMADILTDIDRDAPEEEYVKYYDYCLRVGSIANGELQTPNYDSWLRGCPRMDEEQIIATGCALRRDEFESRDRQN